MSGVKEVAVWLNLCGVNPCESSVLWQSDCHVECFDCELSLSAHGQLHSIDGGRKNKKAFTRTPLTCECELENCPFRSPVIVAILPRRQRYSLKRNVLQSKNKLPHVAGKAGKHPAICLAKLLKMLNSGLSQSVWEKERNPRQEGMLVTHRQWKLP